MSGRPWSAREVAAAYAAEAETLQAELRRCEDARGEHERDLHRIDGEIEAAWQHLGEVLLPALAPATLERLVERTGLMSLSPAAIDEAQAREDAALRQRLAEIEAMPEFVDRQKLGLELDLRVAECDESLASLQTSLAPLRGEPEWERLRLCQYGRPDYLHRWYHLAYYRDWKAADELVERLGSLMGASEWAGLLARVEETEAAARTLEGEREQLTRRRADLERLARERDQTAWALAQLPERTLAGARGRLRQLLEPLGGERIAALFPEAPTATLALQRIAGLTAKRRHLEEVASQYLRELHEQLTAALARNRRDQQKIARPKNRGRQFPAAEMTHRFRDRSPARMKRAQRYHDTRRRLVEFHDYGRGSLVSEFLWWDLMTDGRLDGDFRRDEHHDHDAHARAVAAVAGQAPGDDGLLFDGS